MTPACRHCSSTASASRSSSLAPAEARNSGNASPKPLPPVGCRVPEGAGRGLAIASSCWHRAVAAPVQMPTVMAPNSCHGPRRPSPEGYLGTPPRRAQNPLPGCPISASDYRRPPRPVPPGSMVRRQTIDVGVLAAAIARRDARHRCQAHQAAARSTVCRSASCLQHRNDLRANDGHTLSAAGGPGIGRWPGSTGATCVSVSQTITQRELRNDSGEIMRRLENGETFVVTRRGVPVGELIPVRRPQFAHREKVKAAFVGAARLDRARFRDDLDRHVDQDATPRG